MFKDDIYAHAPEGGGGEGYNRPTSTLVKSPNRSRNRHNWMMTKQKNACVSRLANAANKTCVTAYNLGELQAGFIRAIIVNRKREGRVKRHLRERDQLMEARVEGPRPPAGKRLHVRSRAQCSNSRNSP